jgi:hypothetical protein
VVGGCSRGKPTLTLNGTPALSLPLDVSFNGTNGTPVILFGLPQAPLPLCVGGFGTCQLLVSMILVVPGTSFSLKIPCDPLLIGGKVGLQGIDVLSTGGCPASAFGFDFRMSDMLEVTIL